MATAALVLVFLILTMTFSHFLSNESVKAAAAILATLVTGSATSNWNSF